MKPVKNYFATPYKSNYKCETKHFYDLDLAKKYATKYGKIELQLKDGSRKIHWENKLPDIKKES